MAKKSKYNPQLDEMLQRTNKAVRRAQELIAKTRDLRRQFEQLRNGRR